MSETHERKSRTKFRELHQNSIVIDLHVDSFLLNAQFGYDFLKKHRAYLPLGAFFGHADLPRMNEGSVNAVGFGVVVNPINSAQKVWQRTLRIIHSFQKTCKRSNGILIPMKSPSDISSTFERGQICGFLGLEGAHTLGGELDHLNEAYELGVRYITLTHFSSNKAAFCAKGWNSRRHQGLTDWGRELIKRMNTGGIVVDLAHINTAGFLEAVKISTKPCMISHGTAASVHEHWRATDDKNLTALFEGGGIIGIMFAPQFLCSKLQADSKAVFRHIDYIVTRFGDDYVALGSDYDGYIAATPKDMRDISKMESITQRMFEAGYSDERIRKILGMNVLRILKANEGA